MRHGDIFNAAMSVVHGTFSPRTAETRYNVPNRNILQVATELESTQEQCDTPLVEYYNKQHIFAWVRDNLRLPLVKGQGYTE